MNAKSPAPRDPRSTSGTTDGPPGSPRDGARTRGSWRLGLAVSMLTLVVGFVVLEVGARVVLVHFSSREVMAKYLRARDLPAHALRYESHPHLCYALNPAFRSDDGRDRHNALGMRGDETTETKPEGVVRIACIGGSTTYTAEVDDWRASYPAQLESVLREAHGRDDVEVLNCGVPGYTSWESMLNLELRVWPLDPDVVIVYHATNDVHARLVPPETYRRDNTGYRHAWTQRLGWWDRSMVLHVLGVQYGFSQRNRLRDWVNRLDERAPEAQRMAWLDANPPVHFRANLAAMANAATQHGVPLVFASWAYVDTMDDYAGTPPYVRGYREHNDVLREVAVEFAQPFFDFATVMPRDTMYWVDGRHNNAAGARVKAELFARFLVDEGVLPAR